MVKSLPGLIVLAACWALFEPSSAGGAELAFLGGLISSGIKALGGAIKRKVFGRPRSLPRAPGLPAPRSAPRLPTPRRLVASGAGAVAGASAARAVARSSSGFRAPRASGRQIEWIGPLNPGARVRGGSNPLDKAHQPLTDEADKFGRPIAVEPAFRDVVHCPPGYVAVTRPDGLTVCMLKGPARSAGLWRGRSKPPISASDWKKLKVADRVKKKARKIAETAGGTVKGLPRK